MKKLISKVPNNVKTLAWNFLYLFLALLVNFLIDNLADFKIPTEYVAMVALLLAGASKYLATKKK